MLSDRAPYNQLPGNKVCFEVADGRRVSGAPGGELGCDPRFVRLRVFCLRRLTCRTSSHAAVIREKQAGRFSGFWGSHSRSCSWSTFSAAASKRNLPSHDAVRGSFRPCGGEPGTPRTSRAPCKLLWAPSGPPRVSCSAPCSTGNSTRSGHRASRPGSSPEPSEATCIGAAWNPSSGPLRKSSGLLTPRRSRRGRLRSLEGASRLDRARRPVERFAGPAAQPENVRHHRAMDQLENVRFEPAPADKLPRCPHCKQELQTIWIKGDGLGICGRREIWMCPHCEAFLSYNAWKR